MPRETRSRNPVPTPRGLGAYVPGPGAARPAGTPARGTPAAQPAPSHDFRPSQHIPEERQRLVAAVFERLARSLEPWLAARLRAEVRLVMTGVEPMRFDELAAALPTPCASFTFELRDGSRRHGLIDVGHELAFFLVERLFGGSGEGEAPDRALTPIERMAVRTVVERALRLLEEAWREHAALDLAPSGFESSPALLGEVGRREPMLAARIEVATEYVKGLLVVALPAAAVEPALAGAFGAGSPTDRAAERVRAESALLAARVMVAARLPAVRVAMRELAALREGEVLATGIPTTAELHLLVGDRARFLAAAGRVGQRLACRVLAPITTPTPVRSGAPNAAAEEHTE